MGPWVPLATTDGEANGATPTDLLESTLFRRDVLASNPTPVGIFEAETNLGNFQVRVMAPPQTAALPLRILFQLDDFSLPLRGRSSDIEVLRDGAAVNFCTGPPLVASPDPCIEAISELVGGDVEISLLTSTASLWTLVVPQRCPRGPRTTCQSAVSRSTLVLRDRDGEGSLNWHWRPTGSFDLEVFGDPVSDTHYALCMYQELDVGEALALQARAAADGDCAGKGCWAQLGRQKFRYVDPDELSEGLRRVLLRAGNDPRVRVNGRGAQLDLPALPLGLPLTVQLQAGNRECFEAVYENALRNTSSIFKARRP
jgi:hypothetical protein